jgi:two-component system OmpR family response regulator
MRLRKAGYHTVVAFDAMQAVMLAMKMPLAAVILDLSMPAGSGIEVLRRLRASNRTSMLPILILTGSMDDHVAEQVLELGADAYFKKPLEFESLEPTLRRLIDDNTAKPLGFMAPRPASR